MFFGFVLQTGTCNLHILCRTLTALLRAETDFVQNALLRTRTRFIYLAVPQAKLKLSLKVQAKLKIPLDSISGSGFEGAESFKVMHMISSLYIFIYSYTLDLIMFKLKKPSALLKNNGMSLSCLTVTYCITTDMLYRPLCHSIKIAMCLPHYHPRVGHYISVNFCFFYCLLQDKYSIAKAPVYMMYYRRTIGY